MHKLLWHRDSFRKMFSLLFNWNFIFCCVIHRQSMNSKKMQQMGRMAKIHLTTVMSQQCHHLPQDHQLPLWPTTLSLHFSRHFSLMERQFKTKPSRMNFTASDLIWPRVNTTWSILSPFALFFMYRAIVLCKYQCHRGNQIGHSI